MKSFVRIIAAIMAAVMLTVFTACGKKEMPSRLDGMYSSADETLTSSNNNQPTVQNEADDKEYSAPKFKSGTYTMKSSSIREQYAYSGKEIASAIKMSQIYTYQIKLTVNKNGSMKAVYTFKRIQTSYEGSTAEAIDTNDKSGKSNANSAYYDLIGKSFTVNISKDYRLAISGVNEITKKYPDTAFIINDDNMLEIASDLFYNIDDRLKIGSFWQLDQSGVENTYTLNSVNESNMMFDISGGKLSIPEPYATEGGAVYSYEKCLPLKGSLVVSRSNRMIQEQSSYQENSGTISFNNKSFTFTDSVNSVCSVTKSK